MKLVRAELENGILHNPDFQKLIWDTHASLGTNMSVLLQRNLLVTEFLYLNIYDKSSQVIS